MRGIIGIFATVVLSMGGGCDRNQHYILSDRRVPQEEMVAYEGGVVQEISCPCRRNRGGEESQTEEES